MCSLKMGTPSLQDGTIIYNTRSGHDYCDGFQHPSNPSRFRDSLVGHGYHFSSQ